MTLDEKIAIVHGNNTKDGRATAYVGYVPGNSRLNIPAITLNDGPEGFRAQDNPGTSTQWPSGLSSAAAWNTTMTYEFGRAMGAEFAGKGTTVQFGPGVNVARVPLGGRNFEYLAGEDPYIGIAGVAAMVKGIQSQNVIANPKHYILNNQEDNRHFVSANIDNRTLAEIYFSVFEAAANAGALSMMCSNNRINDQYSCANHETLTGFLKGRSNFTGWVLSDYRATQGTVASALGGLDMQLPGCVKPDPTDPINCLSDPDRPNFFGEPLKQAVVNGQVPLAVLDDKVFRILYALFAIGAFDRPASGTPATNVTSQAHADQSRFIATQSATLISNRDQILPLTASELHGKTLAVIGAAADSTPITGGGGSGEVVPARIVTVLTALRAELGGAALGAAATTINYYNGSDPSEAAKVAAAADLAIAVVASSSHEGADRQNLTLGGSSVAVAAAAAQSKTIVVAITPGAFLTPWKADAAATLVMWLPGQEEGLAVTDVLFGREDSSGRLPLTLPNKENEMEFTPEQYPGVNNESTYSEKLEVGYRWYQSHNVLPAYPFGHGISLAGENAFVYSNLVVSSTSRTVSAIITNNGLRAGVEVAQLYLAFPVAAGEPPLVLRGFEKVRIERGKAASVSFALTERDVSVADASGNWHLFPGTYGVSVGSSCEAIHLKGELQV